MSPFATTSRWNVTLNYYLALHEVTLTHFSHPLSVRCVLVLHQTKLPNLSLVQTHRGQLHTSHVPEPLLQLSSTRHWKAFSVVAVRHQVPQLGSALCV